jgi:hypothetical protein
MNPRRLGLVILAWAGAALAFALTIAAVLLPPVPGGADTYMMAVFVLLMTGLVSMGLLITSQRPRNSIGWLLLVAAVLFGISIMGGGYAELSVSRYSRDLPLTTFFAWVTGWTFAPAIGIVVIFVPLLFPTGRLPSPRWWPILIPAVLGPLAGAAPAAFRPGPMDVPGNIVNPIGIPGAGPLLDAVNLLSIMTAGPALLMVIVSLVLRYRRGDAVEREQIKWFAYPASVAAVALAIGLPDVGLISDIAWTIALSAMSLVPVAIAIAILRHRLFDIDVIINRTLVYGALSLLLAAIYIGSVLLLQELLRPLASDSGLAVAASTLAVVALFQPLRRRIQAVVDRRFYRSRYDASKVVVGFMTRLRDEVELDHLTDELAGSISSALQPSSVLVWLRGRQNATRV